MAREKIKLSFHKRTRRYRKMYKGSDVRVQGSRRRHQRRATKAWEQFKLFRSKVDSGIHAHLTESKPYREYYEPAIQDQQRMAEWYAHEGDREMLEKINANIKELKRGYDTSVPPPTPFYDDLLAELQWRQFGMAEIVFASSTR